MTLKEALERAVQSISKQHIPDALLESRILLTHALQISHAELHLRLNSELSPQQWQSFWPFVERRLKREPAAYITGHKEFYGLDFYVDRRVLIPRPESELLVELGLKFARDHRSPSLTIADIGTGSGALAISLAWNVPGAAVYATDISAGALEVAALNVFRYGLAGRVTLLQGNLLDPLPEVVDLIVANLPYVHERDADKLEPELGFEPREALYAGPDGLDRIRLLFEQARSKGQPRGCLLVEIGQGQAGEVSALARQSFPQAKIALHKDLGGIERVVAVGFSGT